MDILRRVVLVLLAGVVVAAGLAYVFLLPRWRSSVCLEGDSLLPFETFAERAAFGDLVFVGTVEGFARTENFLLNTPDPAYAPDDEINFPRYDARSTYRVTIEQIIKDTDHHGPGTIEWGLPGRGPYTPGPCFPANGSRWLFFMGRDVDGTYYLSDGIYSVFDIDGPRVRYLSGEAVPYAKGMSPDEFMAALRAALSTGTPPIGPTPPDAVTRSP
jgi:hypothetical protein